MNRERDTVKTPEESYESAVFELAIHQMLNRDMDTLKKSTDGKTSSAIEHAAQARLSDMLTFIDQQVERNQSYLSHWKQHLLHALKIAAIVIMIMNLGFTIATAASPIIRAKIIGFLTDITPSHVHMGFQSTGIFIEIPENWSENYYPGYIPENYHLVDSVSRGGISIAEYADDDNNILTIKVCDIHAFSRLNVENAQISYMTIQDNRALVLEQAYGTVNIIWTTGNRYFIISGCNIQLTKSVAESMQLIQP